MSDPPDPKPQPPSRALSKPLSQCTTIGEALATAQFQRSVADAAPAQMTAQRLMATFRQAARNKPEFDQCNLMSVLGVFMTCTFLGLEPNTPLGHAYMIPFKKRRWDKASRSMVDDGYDLQLIIGYQGYLDLAYRSPRVQSVAAHAVYEGDDFSFEYGSNEHLQHRPKGLAAEDDLPRYFYMFSKLQGGQAFEVLPTSRVLRIRNGSQGYASALRAKEDAEKKGWKVPASYTEAPWVKHFTAMGQKTAMRAGYKWLPKTVEMAAVARLEDGQDRGLIDFGPVIEGNVNPLDEDLPMMTVPGADPGAAFGERGGDEPPDDDAPADPPTSREPQPPAKPTPSKPTQPKATASTPPKAAAPTTQAEPATPPAPPPAAAFDAFEAFLAGDDGDVIEDMGDAGGFTDPVKFATAYRLIWQASRERQALSEHNADGLEDAHRASAEARAILDELTDDESVQHAANPPTLTVLNKPDGTPDLRGYIAALRESATHQTADSVSGWSDRQRQTIITLPAVTRRAAEKIVADRRTELGADKLPQAAAAQEPEQSPPPSDDDRDGAAPAEPESAIGEVIAPSQWSRDAKWVVDELSRARNEHDMDALSTNAAVRAKMVAIKALDESEFDRVRDFAAGRRAEMKGT